MQRTRSAHKERGWYAPHNILLASCPSGRRSGSAVRRFDSLVLSEVPDVVLCLCAQGEGAFLRIAPQHYKKMSSFIFMCRLTMCVTKIVVETEAFWSAVFKEHAETLHGMVRLIIVRVAPFRRPLGIFFSAAFVDAATSCRRSKKRGVAFSQSSRSLFHVRVNL